MTTILKISRRLAGIVAVAALVVAMGGTWMTSLPASADPVKTPTATQTAATQPAPAPSAVPAAPAPAAPHAATKSAHKELTGKLNLNMATEAQLMLLPTVGPAKAERIVEWRNKNGGFKRTADLRRVKGFGYKTFKKLEPYLDIKGDTTLAVK